MCQNPDQLHPLEQLAPDGPQEVISIHDEQAAPMADIAAFAEELKAFSRYEYAGDAPYELLVRRSQFAWNQYDQFAAVLIEAAKATGVDERDARSAVELFRWIYIDAAGESSDILSAIRRAAEDQEHADQVSVLSIPCGSGKSTALTRLIHEVIQRDNGEGLIIVTDSVGRMKEYWKAASDNPSFDDVLLRFIETHRDQVAVMNKDNYDAMKSKQYYAPVVVLTTQRYFSWTRERVRELLRWEKGTRPLIIFDEMPYLSEQRDVTAGTLNQVDAALRMKIEAVDDESREKKRKAIEAWENVRSRLLAEMNDLEYTPDLKYAYIPEKDDMELDELLSYVVENRSKLDSDNVKIVQMVQDAAQLIRNWGVYSHRSIASSGKYESKYTVHIDHRDLVTGLEAKVIAMDGTADVSPMYSEDYIHMVPDRNFARSLAYLTIKLCDVPANESDLRGDEGSTAKMIRNYLAEATNRDRNLVVFSNEKMEKIFETLGFDKDHTGHFNNIKGLNSYSQAVNMAQVGLNRKPPVEYLTLDLARKNEIRNELAENGKVGGPIAAMAKAREDLDYSRETMISHVLADLEQNMYRGAIRNAANTQPFTYYVFFAHDQYQPLINAIKARYEPLGAQIELVARPEIESHKVIGTTQERINRIQSWYENWDGQPIKRNAILDQLNMKPKQYTKALEHKDAADIKAKLDASSAKAIKLGHPKGWFVK